MTYQETTVLILTMFILGLSILYCAVHFKLRTYILVFGVLLSLTAVYSYNELQRENRTFQSAIQEYVETGICLDLTVHERQQGTNIIFNCRRQLNKFVCLEENIYTGGVTK